MLPRLQSFFDPHLSALIADNLSTFVSDYDFPLALYVEGERVVYPSPVVMKQASAAYRRWLIDHGVNHYTCRINAVDIPRQSRFRVWVTIFAHHTGRGTFDQTESVYFLRDKRGQLLIEMVECTETPDAAFVRSRRQMQTA
tara:strand:- start:26 stop:448 length:423 start_codon:yes stop_codon:yes gene_type:complete